MKCFTVRLRLLLTAALALEAAATAMAHPQKVFFPGPTGDMSDRSDEVDVVDADPGTEFWDPNPKTTRSPLSQRALPAMPDGFPARCSTDWNAIPYFDADTDEWVCHGLGGAGPCPDGYWFVLDRELTEEGHPRGTCRRWTCGNSTSYLLVDREEGERVCASEGDYRPCPLGMEVLLDPFGDGRCDCVLGNVPFPDPETNEARCFPEYLQGPCADGEQLERVASVFVDGGQEEAQQGPCPAGEQLLDVRGKPKVFRINPKGTVCVRHFCKIKGQIRWSNGVCLDSVSCLPQDAVTLDEETGQLVCDVSLRQIISFDTVCPRGQKKNPNGVCKPVIEFGRSTSQRQTTRLATGGASLKDFIGRRFGAFGSTG